MKNWCCKVKCDAKTWLMGSQHPAWLYATIPSYSAELHNEDIMITLSKLMIYLLHKAWLLQNCLSDIFRALSFTSPYLMEWYLHAQPLFPFAICHWDSKLHSSESIHSPRFAECRIILAVSAALWLGTVKNGGCLHIFQTCISKGQEVLGWERLMGFMSWCLCGTEVNCADWWISW